MTDSVDSSEWTATLLSIGATIQQAIQNLDNSGMQIVLVQDTTGALHGTLTDGDIRRAFLRGMTLSSPLDEIVNRNPLVAPPNLDRELVLQLMQANKIHQLPIVDKERRVVGLHVWDKVLTPAPVANAMVIMAGGRGTRLHPHTQHRPKPMVDVAGKPLLQHIIERAKSEGFERFTIAVHHLGEMIEEYFADGRRFGVSIDYLRENGPLGTAGALSLITAVPECPFVVTNADVVSSVRYRDMLEFHDRHLANATMAVRYHEIQNPFGVVRIRGIEIIGFEEKPIYRSHINGGIYVLSPSVLDQLEPNQPCDMPTLFERVTAAGGKAIVYPMHEQWLDVGRPDDLILAQAMPQLS